MRYLLSVLLVLSPALSATGCGDYLSGPGLSDDPNNVTTLTRPGPLYLSIQQAGAGQHEVAVQMHYVQQVAGINRGAQGADRYLVTGTDFSGYGGAGLLDIRKMQQLARKVGDSLYVGIAKVYEAIDIGLVADTWGDIPYREAADSNTRQPHFDSQLQVYADLQAQLDSAINIFLLATGPTNLGGALDKSELIYGGRDPAALRAVYTAVARSLKARFFLHVAAASRAGVSGAPPAAYDSALKYAVAGISSPADDLLWFHDASANGTNIWWVVIGGGDLVPGAAIIEIMNRRIAAGVDDTAPIAFYFTQATDGRYHGYRPAGAIVATSGGIYDGSGPYSRFGAFLDQDVSDGSFRQPELTYAETQLIAAEATWQRNCAGCLPTAVVPAAQPFLDAARRDRRYGSATFGSAPGTLPASLQNIIEEKYVALFLNPEVWSDWKRTCLPSLAPAPGTVGIPGRLPYGQNEINTNPDVPSVSSTGVPITSVSLNPNQPSACPVLNYMNSSPLAN
jgi:hypothetical protein